MVRFIPELPYLDQAGHVYVPLAGDNRSCLKLNRHASQVWRAAVSAPVDRDELPEADRAFLARLVERGALRTEAAR
ncbi:hypothetical protein ACFXKW_19380 [Streptomyces sp. NPDC059193]|uniref:hypothetical protein n=1 Tax=Streptomyces sp. NPDC059193 TaxID=3346763 RepID=UPI0036AD7C40